MTKKKYCGINREGKILITGLETHRVNWSPIARHVQYKVIEMILKDNATEEMINNYIVEIHDNLKETDISEFVFEKIVDCGRRYEAKTRLVKAWESLGLEVLKEHNGNRMTYQCISPRGEVLLGIRWVMDKKEQPIGIPEDEELESYRKFVSYSYYWKKQIIPVVERVILPLGYHIGQKQQTLDGKIIYK